MPKFTDRDSLIDAFKQLGHDDQIAEEFADEQLATKRPILERQSFLRLVNSFVCGRENPDRLKYVYELSDAEMSNNHYAQALRRILDCGASTTDVVAVVRELQYDLLDQLFSMLDTVSNYPDFPIDEFNVYAIDESTNAPELLVDGLHESIDEMKRW